VAGDLDGAGTLNGRAGASVFSIGGPDGRGGAAAGANPDELLSASLAACTAMTIRLQARRRKIPLSHLEVAVSYHHGGDGGRDSFERSITLEGNLRGRARPTDAGRENVSHRADARPQRRHPHER
jgi:putative redox protein